MVPWWATAEACLRAVRIRLSWWRETWWWYRRRPSAPTLDGRAFSRDRRWHTPWASPSRWREASEQHSQVHDGPRYESAGYFGFDSSHELSSVGSGRETRQRIFAGVPAVRTRPS